VKFDYATPLARLIAYHLSDYGDGVEGALAVLENYNLKPDNIKEQLTASLYPHTIDHFSGVSSSTKSALTRAYNE